MHSPPGLQPHPLFVAERLFTSSPEPIYETIASEDAIDIDIESYCDGIPLERMNHIVSGSSNLIESDESGSDEEEEHDRLTALYQACLTARLESSDHHDHTLDGSSDSESDTSETSSIAWDEVDLESLVDSLPEEYSSHPHSESYYTLSPTIFSSLSAPLTLHTLSLPANPVPDPSRPSDSLSDDSSILLLILALNTPSLRSDPWNPIPRILRAVERIRQDQEEGSTVFLFHPPLVTLTSAHSKHSTTDSEEQCTVAHWIDFFRQILEGLTFLHENAVVWGGFDAIEPEQNPSLGSSDPSHPPGLDINATEKKQVEIFMMDISSDPEAFTSTCPKFDYSRYPVKYYFSDLRKARKVSGSLDASSSSLFTQEVQSCGSWLERLLFSSQALHSRLGSPFLPLIQAMKSRTFSADGARKLFEARVKSLNLVKDKLSLDAKVPAVQWRPFERDICNESRVVRRHTASMTRSISSDSQMSLKVSKQPGTGASQVRLALTIGAGVSGRGNRLRAGSLARSKSSPHPIPTLRENKRKEVFGDLSFVKSSSASDVIKSNTSSHALSTLGDKIKSKEAEDSDSTVLMSPSAGMTGIRAVSPTSPVFTIASLDLASLSLGTPPQHPNHQIRPDRGGARPWR
ncbi:hypothetical protein D9757_005627 [Collybiopsis confluens]|uniref:Uncharacterized protein n=1 Tax=Collybiopsis confluens TaxID=2823264 RepID=A0A8H5HSQ7_9AGAR|nr:hypothetical protein D9757_005627 [Collybiopsis confluens]